MGQQQGETWQMDIQCPNRHLISTTYIDAQHRPYPILEPEPPHQLADHGVETRAQTATCHNGSSHVRGVEYDLVGEKTMRVRHESTVHE